MYWFQQDIEWASKIQKGNNTPLDKSSLLKKKQQPQIRNNNPHHKAQSAPSTLKLRNKYQECTADTPRLRPA
jgi:hypothetical protein